MESCNSSLNTNEKLWGMVKSDNVNSIIDATLEIQKTKNKSMMDALLYKPADPRITHRLKYYGMSIYQIKMLSLEILTEIKPPKEITYIPDSSIINFYIQTIKKLNGSQ